MDRLIELTEEAEKLQGTKNRHHLTTISVIGMQQVRALERIATALETLAMRQTVVSRTLT